MCSKIFLSLPENRQYFTFIRLLMSESSNAASVKSDFIKPFSEIPGPKSLPIIGTALNYFPLIGKYDRNRMNITQRLKYEKYGSIVREKILGGLNIVFIYNPDEIEKIFKHDGKYPARRSHLSLLKIRTIDEAESYNSGGLLPTNGEEWHKMRTKYQQALTMENMRKINVLAKSDKIILEFCSEILKNSQADKKDLLPHLMRLSLEIVGEEFFGFRVGNPKYDSVNEPNHLIEAAENINNSITTLENGFMLWRYFNTPLYRKVKNDLDFLQNSAHKIINMMDKKKSCIVNTWLTDENVNFKDLLTMSTDMILAGIDTSSFTMSFVLYHLSTHPIEQEKLHKELVTLLPNKNSPITDEILSKAIYLKRCVKEALRLNPISIGTGRIYDHDIELEGYNIPAQTNVVTMNQVICRLPKYFENPDEFIPERWAPENRKFVNPFALLPFGHGPRACIGRRLAEQQLYLITARIIRMFAIEWTGSSALDCLTPSINRPDSPLNFNFIERLN